MPRQPGASHLQATGAGVLGLLPDPSHRRSSCGSTGRRLIADSFASRSAAAAVDEGGARVAPRWPDLLMAGTATDRAVSSSTVKQVGAGRAGSRGGSKTAVGRSRPRKPDEVPVARRESKSGAGVVRAGSVSFAAAAAPSDAQRAQTAQEQRMREDVRKVRDEYFATLQESAGRVELAMEAIDRYTAAEVSPAPSPTPGHRKPHAT